MKLPIILFERSNYRLVAKAGSYSCIPVSYVLEQTRDTDAMGRVIWTPASADDWDTAISVIGRYFKEIEERVEKLEESNKAIEELNNSEAFKEKIKDNKELDELLNDEAESINEKPKDTIDQFLKDNIDIINDIVTLEEALDAFKITLDRHDYFVAWTVGAGILSKAKAARILGMSLVDFGRKYGPLIEKIEENERKS